MHEAELKDRIKKGEDFHTELKESITDQNKILKGIVSLANSEGGQLIIGVTDSGEIKGIQNIDKNMLIIDDLAIQRSEPPISVFQETLSIDGKIVLIVNVPQGKQRPYRTSGGLYYTRSTNRTRQASTDELLRLFQSRESIFYDETTVHQSDFQDLDIYSFQDFLSNHMEIKAVESELKNYLKNLHLLDKNYKPTVAGILFFGKKPQFYFPCLRVICAIIRGTDLATPPFDKKDLVGRIPDILEDTQRFLNLFLREEHVIQGFEPEIRRQISPVALREALVNAIAHRDLTIPAPIRVIKYDDWIEIRTPGKLPNSVTIDSIKMGGSHVLRNPTIYNLLYKLGMVTDLGSGVRRIITLVQAHCQKEVLFQQTDSEFILTIPLA